ncbi:hypothetical protein GGR57DRAFT_497014 [Xylariaceae sp. FL1272]|nr:hypothetical protein GGR57DRAFT_497014 [Xylariaceae sp. FL1272]
MSEGSDTDTFKIQVIPPDEQGCRFYLEKYKPFRLDALRQDPDAFGSTYARELEFEDDAWLARVKNPSAMTFVAVRMAAVYTIPMARSRGLAKALIKAATEEAIKRAAEQDRRLTLSVVVYATNNAAISVYERCGFVKTAVGPKLVFNACKNTSEEQLDMFYESEPLE